MIAFDLALVTAGAAWDGGSDTFTCPPKFQPSRRPARERDQTRQQRLAWWRTTFRRLIADYADGEVWVEMPIMHSQNPSGQIPTHELHGVLKVAAWDERAVVHEMQNTKLKSWAHKVPGITTPWPMSKDDMVAVAKHLGCQPADDNEADAFLLYAMVTSS
jgi:Holliday junction resolvasome RuvABC endonuclease subunit